MEAETVRAAETLSVLNTAEVPVICVDQNHAPPAASLPSMRAISIETECFEPPSKRIKKFDVTSGLKKAGKTLCVPAPKNLCEWTKNVFVELHVDGLAYIIRLDSRMYESMPVDTERVEFRGLATHTARRTPCWMRKCAAILKTTKPPQVKIDEDSVIAAHVWQTPAKMLFYTLARCDVFYTQMCLLLFYKVMSPMHSTIVPLCVIETVEKSAVSGTFIRDYSKHAWLAHAPLIKNSLRIHGIEFSHSDCVTLMWEGSQRFARGSHKCATGLLSGLIAKKSRMIDRWGNSVITREMMEECNFAPLVLPFDMIGKTNAEILSHM